MDAPETEIIRVDGQDFEVIQREMVAILACNLKTRGFERLIYDHDADKWTRIQA